MVRRRTESAHQHEWVPMQFDFDTVKRAPNGVWCVCLACRWASLLKTSVVPDPKSKPAPEDPPPDPPEPPVPPARSHENNP